MKFSVLVASYNNGRYLSECIDSVLRQTYNNWELIIADDCSTDNSVEIVQSYLGDERIKLAVHKKNLGAGAAFKTAVENSEGEIIGMLGADDALSEDALQKMVSLHQEKPMAALIYSTHYVCDENLKTLKIAEYVGQVNHNYLLGGGRVPSSFATFKAKKYFNSPGISPEFKRAVDQDLYYKLEEQGGEWYFFNEPLYYYRIHKGGISSTGDNIKKARYWHLLAMDDAYKRRKNTQLSVSYNIIRNGWKEYYNDLIKQAKIDKNRKIYLHAVLSLIKISPVKELKNNISLLLNYFNV